MITTEQAAARFGLTPRYFMAKVRLHSIPYVDTGRAYRFTEAALIQLQEALTCRSSSLPPKQAARRTSGSGARILESELTKAQEALIAASQRRRSATSKAGLNVVPLSRKQARLGQGQ